MASRVAARRLFSTTMRRMGDHEKQELKKETKRNPELMVRHIHDQLLLPSPLPRPSSRKMMGTGGNVRDEE